MGSNKDTGGSFIIAVEDNMQFRACYLPEECCQGFGGTDSTVAAGLFPAAFCCVDKNELFASGRCLIDINE